MKAVILAGGMGRRLCSEHTKIAKPLTLIGDSPILCHIIHYFQGYGVNSFVIALGFLAEQVKSALIVYFEKTSPVTIEKDQDSTTLLVEDRNLTITFVCTGLNTQTAGRLMRIRPYVGSGSFALSWCDGLTDINFHDMHGFHKSHGKAVTIAAVHPRSRFGILDIDGQHITGFAEKPKMTDRWVNGGYFLLEQQIFSYIDNDSESWEKEPMQRLIEKRQVMAWLHEGQWQCMDTVTDVDYLNNLWNDNAAFWLNDGLL